MNSTIESGQLKIVASSHGAELQSIKDKESGLEYLWQGDDKHWSRRSPILFPIVGRLKEDSYLFEGNRYQMSQHGFARDSDFELVERSAHHLMYHLEASVKSRKIYPFDFELSITYTLKEDRLTVSYMVENPSDEDLFFSIGAHPAFNCPMKDGEQRSEYTLKFNEEETLDRQHIEGGIRSGETEQVLKKTSELTIEDDLFERDALIFEGLLSNEIALCKDDQPIVTMIFDEFDYLGIWSKSKESPFVCIEPWLGIADHIDHNQQFKEKEGIIELKPREVFTAQYHMIFGGA